MAVGCLFRPTYYMSYVCHYYECNNKYTAIKLGTCNGESMKKLQTIQPLDWVQKSYLIVAVLDGPLSNLMSFR